MTKPLLTGCIKNDTDKSWKTFNYLLEKVSLDDKIGYLYVVDIEFDLTNATREQKVYNEIYPPMIEKQKVIDPCERSVYHLLEQYVEGEKDKPLAYRATAKACATMLQKRFFPMYLEHLAFIIKRAGWNVTKIHSHLRFEQKTFKKKFILINQKSRQNSKNDIEKDFYKLMNNQNFGYDCQNNLDNCQFVPIFDEIKEMTYLKRYYNYFDPRVSKFVTADLIREKIEEKFNENLLLLDKEDKFYPTKLNLLKAERLSSLEAADNFEKKKRK